MEPQQIKELILKELPTLMQQDSSLREWVLNIGRTQFADKVVTESRFDQMMRVIQQKIEEDRQSREEQTCQWEENQRKWEENQRKWEENQRKWEENQRQWEENQRQLLELERKSDERWEENQRQLLELERKSNERWEENQRQLLELERKSNERWEENQRQLLELGRKSDERWEENQRQLLELERKSNERWEENQRKWEENQRKWDANQQVINQMLESIRKLDKKYDQTLGALGTRWGLHSEDTFRNALSGILQEFPSGVEVIHVNEFDNTGEVFGRPDQVELDLIIRNGRLLIAEIKSSMSRGEMYLFERKARFYERRHQRTAQRLIVISPMVDKKAQEIAAKLGITVYSYTDEVELTE